MGFNFLKAAKNCTSLVRRNSPLILTCVGIGLGVTSTVMAVKATPEAHDIYKKIQDSNIPENEKKKEVIKNVVPMYLPSALTGCTAIACVLGGYKIQADRLAEMTAAYLMATNSLQDYKQTVLDKFGVETANDIQKTTDEKEAARMTPDEKEKRVPHSNKSKEEEVLILDSVSGQYFRDTKDHVWMVIKDIQSRLASGAEQYISGSDYAYELDLNNSIALDHVGWVAGSDLTPKWVKFIGPGGEEAWHLILDTDPIYDEIKPRYY